MEDAGVQRYCHEIARQILVPPRTFTPLSTSSTGGSHSSSNSNSGRGDVPLPLRRAAEAVATRAVTLYRLCKAPQNDIAMASSTASSGGGGGGDGSGGKGGIDDAAFCVCASLAVLQPNVWQSLRWRAVAVRPRGAPRLLLGSPRPVPFALRELEKFIARSAHVLASPLARQPVAVAPQALPLSSSSASLLARTVAAAGAASSTGGLLATAPPPLPASRAAPGLAPNTSQQGGRRRRGPGSHAAAAAAVVEPVMDEVQSESIAACYFLSVSTPAERRRYREVFQVPEEVLRRRRDELRARHAARREREREAGGGDEPEPPQHDDGDGKARADEEGELRNNTAKRPRHADNVDKEDDRRLSSATVAAQQSGREKGQSSSDAEAGKGGGTAAAAALPGPSPHPGALWVTSTTAAAAPVLLYAEEEEEAKAGGGGGSGGLLPGRRKRLHPLSAPVARGGGRGATGRNNDDSSSDDGSEAVSSGADHLLDEDTVDDGDDEDGDDPTAEKPKGRQTGKLRQAPQRSRRTRGGGSGSATSADPEALWSRLYAVATGDVDCDSGDGNAEEEDEEAGSRGGRRHRGLDPVSATASLFPSSRPIHLVDLAAQVELVRGQMHWRRLETCLANPLLYHYELLSRGLPRTLPTTLPDVARRGATGEGEDHSACRGEGTRHPCGEDEIQLDGLYGALGSAYTSRCRLVCEEVPYRATTANEPLPTTMPLTALPLASSSPSSLRHAPLVPWLCHPAHFLFPTRAHSLVPSATLTPLSTSSSPSSPPPTFGLPATNQTVFAPSLYSAPASVVTGTFLWTRLLICATWLVAYADYVLPIVINSGGGDDDVGEERGDRDAPRNDAWDRERLRGQLSAHVTSPPMTAILSYCVSVVKEARQYDAIGCPVCDTLSTAVSHQQQQWQQQQQQQHAQDGKGEEEKAEGTGGRRVADALAALVPAMASAPAPAIQWGSLREDRKALARSMRPFLALDEKEGEPANPTDGVDGGEAVERGLDAVGRRLRRCWQRFTRAKSLSDAAAAFAACARVQRDEAAVTKGEAVMAHPVTGEAHEVFLQALARRLSPLAELLSGTAGFMADCRPSPTSVPASATATAHSPKAQQQLRQAAHVLAVLGLLPKERETSSPGQRAREARNPDSTAAAVVAGMTQLQHLTLREVVKVALFGGRSVALWGPLLLFPLPPPPITDGAASVAPEQEVAEDAKEAEEGTGPTVTHGVEHHAHPHHPAGQSGGSGGEPSFHLHHQQLRHRQQRHKLKSQRLQLHELLSFAPFIPLLGEADAVLECARCFSFFHQNCVGPVQSDVAGAVFLCHTCRMKRGNRAGLAVTPFP